MSSSFIRDLRVQSNSQDRNMLSTSPLSSPPSSTEFSSSILSSQSTQRQRPAQRPSSSWNQRLPNHWDPRTPQQKLMATEHLWREQQWGIKTFLQKWVKTESNAFANQQQIWLLQKALKQSEVQTAHAAAASHHDDLSAAKLIEKFDALVEKLFFSKYEPSTSIKKLDYSLAFKIIKLTAPTWTALLTQLMSNQQQKWSSYNRSKNQQPNQQ